MSMLISNDALKLSMLPVLMYSVITNAVHNNNILTSDFNFFCISFCLLAFLANASFLR